MEYILYRYGWKANDLKNLVLTVEQYLNSKKNKENVSWHQLLSLSENIIYRISFSFDDLIYLFCKYYEEAVYREHFNELQLTLQKLDFDIEQISAEFLHSRIKFAYEKIKAEMYLDKKETEKKATENLIYPNTYSRSNRSFSSPHYGTEWVSGHFRTRNGNVEWVSGHFRTRYK